ncbi:sensor histidine kinase [Neobacillus drentensis]|uniref:sensor histidine kinase n=1 Tax=Neobacillus drentensis TaxID=220684 RepID=UPI002FFE03BB
MVKGFFAHLKQRPITVKTKLIGYTMLVVVPVFLFCLVYKHQAEEVLKEKAGKLIVESVGLSSSWLDEVLSGAVRISAATGSDRVVTQYILSQQGTLADFEEIINTREAAERLEDILNTETRVTSIWIYLPQQGKVLSTEFGLYQLQDIEALKWIKEKALHNEMQAWIYPTKDLLLAKGLLDITGLKKSPQNVTFIRILPGVGTDQLPVIIGTTYHKFSIEALLHEVSEKTKTTIYLYNQSNKLVNSIGVDKNKGSVQWKSQQSRDYFFSKDRLITFSTSELTGWKIVASAPIENYMGGLSLLNWLIISFLFIVLLLSLYSARALTKGIHRPLKQLLNHFKSIEQGDLAVRMDYKKKDEFGVVAEGFNQMATTQENLIRSVYEERIAKQQAELNFLTSQINPHFLYNTLGALYSMAKRVDATLAQALISMSRLFRFSLTDGNDMITVKESMDTISYYIYLLNIRNPHKYVLETFIEPDAQMCKVPKLIIQPIVENSVKHGIEKTNRLGQITITVTVLSNDLLIMISDNGIGMSKEKLVELKKQIKESPKQKKTMNKPEIEGLGDSTGTNYALINIYKRLQLKYGDDFQFTIGSEFGKGTTVTFRLKKEIE